MIKDIKKKDLERDLLKRQHQEDLIDNSLAIQEKERMRIAGDLHDGAINELLRIQLINTDILLSQKLKEVIKTLRCISHDLYPPLIDSSLFEDLLVYVLQPYNPTKKVSITILKAETDLQLARNVKLQVYRIVQELVNNIIKHANSLTIDVVYRITERAVSLIIRDEGLGFDRDQKKSNGLGLKNIALRCHTLGASYKFKKNSPRGVSFILYFIVD